MKSSVGIIDDVKVVRVCLCLRAHVCVCVLFVAQMSQTGFPARTSDLFVPQQCESSAVSSLTSTLSPCDLNICSFIKSAYLWKQ